MVPFDLDREIPSKFRMNNKEVGLWVGVRVYMECPCRETSPEHGRNPVLFSSSKFMTTLMLTGHQHKLQDLILMVYRKGFGAGVVFGLRACVFLHCICG